MLDYDCSATPILLFCSLILLISTCTPTYYSITIIRFIISWHFIVTIHFIVTLCSIITYLIYIFTLHLFIIIIKCYLINFSIVLSILMTVYDSFY